MVILDALAEKAAVCLAYCFNTYFHQSPSKALHRTAIPARSLTQAQFALHVEQWRQVGNFAQGNLPARFIDLRNPSSTTRMPSSGMLPSALKELTAES